MSTMENQDGSASSLFASKNPKNQDAGAYPTPSPEPGTNEKLPKPSAAAVSSQAVAPTPPPEAGDVKSGPTSSAAPAKRDDENGRPTVVEPQPIIPQSKQPAPQDDEKPTDKSSMGQEGLIEHINNLKHKGKANPFQILSFPGKERLGKNSKPQGVMKTYLKKARAIHPNSTPSQLAESGKNAFEALNEAAKLAGISQKDIETVENWDGEGREGQILQDGKWTNDPDPMDLDDPQDLVNDAASEHQEFYRSKYTEANDDVLKLIAGDKTARVRVDKINNEIQEHNKSSLLEESSHQDGLIDTDKLLSLIDVVKSSDQKLAQYPDDDTHMQSLEAAQESLRKYLAEKAYPLDWEPDLTTATQSVETDGISWPRYTGRTKKGQRLMAWRKQGNGHRCVVETEPGCPVFELQSGSEAGLAEVREFVHNKSALQLSGADEYRKWSAKDRPKFVKLVAVAIADYKSHKDVEGYRVPETRCFVEWRKNDGKTEMKELPRSALHRVLRKDIADKEIEDFCETHKKISPLQRRPQSQKSPKHEAAGEKIIKQETAESSERKVDLLEKKMGAMDDRLSQMADMMEQILKAIDPKQSSVPSVG